MLVSSVGLRTFTAEVCTTEIPAERFDDCIRLCVVDKLGE